MGRDEATRDVVGQAVRFGLSQLRAGNAHHEFEKLCLEFFRKRINPRVVPATGPVGAGGDQGRDFETFAELIDPVTPGSRIAAICTLQVRRVPEKIKDDLGKVAAGVPASRVYVFREADIPAGIRHGLIAFAQRNYGIELEVFDGTTLAVQLAAPDLIAVAARYLSLPVEALRGAALETAEAHAWASRQGPGVAAA